MSIAPLPPPAPGTVPPGRTGAGTTTGEDGGFGALVAALLGGGPTSSAEQPPTVPASVPPTVPATAAPTDEQEPVDGEAGVDGPEDAGDGPGDAVPPTLVGLALLVPPPVLRPETPPAAIPTGETLPPVGPAVQPAVEPAVEPAAPGGSEAVAPASAAPPADAAAPASASPAATNPAPTAAPQAPPAVPLAPLAPVAPVALTPVAGASETRPVPVAAQLAPEVTRLVSQGDGVHRITMRLQPEALGEVRVTLTVRDGEVHVRLAGGDQARQALLEGAPELRRVLELTGATETRVVVRDLAGGLAAAPPNASPNPAPGGAGGGGDTPAPGQGQAGSPDHHAGTRGGSTAKDGLTDGAPLPRPEPARRSPRGVDLTM